MTTNAPSLRAVLMLVVLTWPLQSFDDAVRAWVRAHRPAALEPAMSFASGRQSRAVLVIGAGVAVLAGAAGRAVAAETAVALIPVNLAVEGLKWSVNRTRPDGDRNRRNSSFPSSHAANALTVALVVGRRWRRAAWPLGAFALLVAYSRMWFDRHWASDLLGAAVLALAGAGFAGWLRQWWTERRRKAA